MEKYQKSKIYKLVSNSSDLVYYGSSYCNLSRRIAQHRCEYKRYLNRKGKSYITSFKLMELGDIEIILVEDFPCERKEQLISRERFYIENNECVNKVIPGRTGKEYRQDNKEIISERYKKWNGENKERLQEYRNANKVKIKEYNKEYHQKNNEKRLKQMEEWRNANKDKIKDYELQNKEKIAERHKKYGLKIICECGSETSKSHLARHKKSKKHIDFSESV